MVNWVPIVAATLAAVPSAAIFFAAFGRYDGAFRDNVVFLYFIGGLALGMFLGIFTLFLSAVGPLVQVIGLAMLYPIALVAAANRRKWQGERHSIFNGGSVGLGVAVMLSFSVLFYHAQNARLAGQAAATTALREITGNSTVEAPAVDTAVYAFDPLLIAQGALFAIAMAGLFFGLGLLAGEGVRQRKQMRIALLGTAVFVAPAVFIEEYLHTRAWLWLVLLVAYGAIFAYAAERRLLHRGITDEDRKQRRRRKRAEAL